MSSATRARAVASGGAGARLDVRHPLHTLSRTEQQPWTGPSKSSLLPVSDIDRSVAFYRDQVGFDLDHDTQNEHMHVVQLTPPGPVARS